MLEKTPIKNMYDLDVPLIFTDGTDFFKKLSKEYIVHETGFFILAPSGAGKTHYINHQKVRNWIDGDMLWEGANAHPRPGWWLENNDVIKRVDTQSDIITVQAKKLGFWVMGASNNWLRPDAIVLPHWTTHKKYIKYRENNNYDGGAKSDNFDQVLGHRNVIESWAKKGVPKFKSIEEAADYLAEQKNNQKGETQNE
ncbi:MAG: hypothetical protein WC437_03590 [Patescibacteria group bacterium]|jgi:hypothetical protein|nr:hypothetical protein [Patescibacteria group bacterium]